VFTRRHFSVIISRTPLSFLPFFWSIFLFPPIINVKFFETVPRDSSFLFPPTRRVTTPFPLSWPADPLWLFSLHSFPTPFCRWKEGSPFKVQVLLSTIPSIDLIVYLRDIPFPPSQIDLMSSAAFPVFPPPPSPPDVIFAWKACCPPLQSTKEY